MMDLMEKVFMVWCVLINLSLVGRWRMGKTKVINEDWFHPRRMAVVAVARCSLGAEAAGRALMQ